MMWPFKWKLSSCTSTWCYLFFKISQNEIWIFDQNLSSLGAVSYFSYHMRLQANLRFAFHEWPIHTNHHLPFLLFFSLLHICFHFRQWWKGEDKRITFKWLNLYSFSLYIVLIVMFFFKILSLLRLQPRKMIFSCYSLVLTVFIYWLRKRLFYL